jgi:hypothetical protein
VRCPEGLEVEDDGLERGFWNHLDTSTLLSTGFRFQIYDFELMIALGLYRNKKNDRPLNMIYDPRCASFYGEFGSISRGSIYT